MAVKSPETYGDYYWRQQVDAAKWLDEENENILSIQAKSIIGGLGIIEQLPPELAALFTTLMQPPSPGYGAVLGRFVSETADGILGQSLQHATRDFNYWLAEKFRDQRIDFETATTLYRRKAITDDLFMSRMASEGYKDAEGATYYLSRMPYPSIPDIITYARYHGDPDNIRGAVWDWFDVPERDFPLWEWLGLQRLTTEQIHTAYRRGLITDVDAIKEYGRVGWDATDRLLQQELGWQIPNAMLMVQGGLMLGRGRPELLKDISLADIHPQYAENYLDAVLTKPASQDIVNYLLRTDPALSDIGNQLQRIGIHPDYIDVYKTLAYQIPPLGDLISMAVREAFTPTIAARFGQYEDFPEVFAHYAAQKGLSKEWAERYWAAHWSLPSVTQGFEMLHRGIISREELTTLLRALDVMPFWRDKLIQMSYKPLTRVDVRRMYKEGVLDESGVLAAYLDVGYNEENAQRMTEFTIKQALSSQAKFTTTDVVKAYTKRLASYSEASSLLRDLGLNSDDIRYILSRAEYKRQWDLTDQKIRGIRNLYKKQAYTEDKARDQLAKLALPAEQINVLIEQWWYEVAEEIKPTWTVAQTLNFVKKELITPERGQYELRLMGYDAEHIKVYMDSLK